MLKTFCILNIFFLILTFSKNTYAFKPDMVLIPEGEFIMGGVYNFKSKDFATNGFFDDEKPAHKVFLDNYYIGRFEVTNKEYREFVSNTDHEEPETFEDEIFNKPNLPLGGISWLDAVEFTKWLSKKTKKSYRLPTEAEWEKAARGTDGRWFPWGNEMPGVKGLYRANFRATGIYSERGKDGFFDTSPVGSFKNGKSPYGLFDMAGNMWEWCSDWFEKNYYKRSPEKNPKGAKTGMFRVLRGGSWLNSARELRVTNRISEFPDDVVINYGMRLAIDGK